MEWWQVVLSVSAGVTALAVVGGVFWANTRNSYNDQERRNNAEAIKSYQTVREAQATEIQRLRDDIKDLHRLHNEAVEKNGKLQGKIDAYATLPLQELSNNQRIITQVQLLIAKHMGIDGVDMLIQEMGRATTGKK